MIVRSGVAAERDLGNCRRPPRKRGGIERRAPDHAAVAVRGLLAGLAPVDQHYVSFAKSEMNGDRRPDDTAPEHQHISLHQYATLENRSADA